MIGTDAPSVRGAASSTVLVGLAALAFAHSDVTPLQPPPLPWPDAVSAQQLDERYSAIAYAEDVLAGIGQPDLFGPEPSPPRMLGPDEDDPLVPVEVTIGNPLAIGGLDRAIIRRYLKRSAVALRRCYHRTVALDAVPGEGALQLAINVRGEVREAEVVGLPAALSSCITETIQAIVFSHAPELTQAHITLRYAHHRPELSRTERAECNVIRSMPASMQLDFDPTLARKCELGTVSKLTTRTAP